MTESLNMLGLGLLSLALFISLMLNVIFCIRRRTKLCRDTDERCFTHICTAESPSQDEGHHFPNLNDDEQQDNLHGQHENPIYGNISSDRRDSIDVCYEIMTMQHTRDRMKGHPSIRGTAVRSPAALVH
ncbi:uncharacterized protein LOC117742802 isoform X2 [Cyclopterus lumpus]|uniref:uncharacterized protein LOC117742802 isoform X2 n=1 Tax=Cyclopterus lumpus TaxID=8103 RepID=UPI001486541D|nr:uncharacterized protein LOC117742802 isoform X2 [Cyclopterus lumpus]XP_034406330.1 uncharacterized protein LOC117742802 isoform X2 [Cyclopterus lumpus]